MPLRGDAGLLAIKTNGKHRNGEGVPYIEYHATLTPTQVTGGIARKGKKQQSIVHDPTARYAFPP